MITVKGYYCYYYYYNYNNNNNFFFFLIKQNFIHRFKKKIDYLQIQKYEILKYIPYVHFSCLRKRIVVK